jgi:methyl-accepting chemotaxis protein
MARSLTARCWFAFSLLELVFSSCVIFAFAHLLGIGERSVAFWVLLAMTGVKIVAWSTLMTWLLRPYEEFAATPEKARSAAQLLAADAALHRASFRFGAGYAGCWAVSYALAVAWLWHLGPEQVPLGSGTTEVMALVCSAILLGAFSFSFPLMSLLTSEAANQCSLLADRLGVHLPRQPMSLQGRIGLIAFCLGLAPTLWVMGLGYMRQVESSREQNVTATRLAAAQVANAMDHASSLQPPSHDALQKLARAAAGEDARVFLLNAAGRPLDGAPATEAAADVASLIAKTPAQTSGSQLRLRPERTLAFERSAGGPVAVVALDTAAQPSSSYVISASIFALVVMIWAPLCAYILGRAVSDPIQRLTGAARRIVEEGKLTEMGQIPVTRNDEVGALTSQFNEVLALMRSLSDAARAIARGDLRGEVSGIGELPDAFRGMVDGLQNIVRQIRETSVELAGSAAEIFAASQEQESAATMQSSAVVEISRTMDSLSESAAHVSDAVQGVLSNAERTLKNTDEMVQRIGQLTALANRIGEILDVIREIADRSDLLALNGSLEASRAGDGGRGFALVSAEMRRLAERVTASVQDVKRLVADIRDSGSSTVMATEESRKLAEGTTEAARQITFVTQQQRSGTEQVSLSVKNVAEVVSQAASATSQTRTSAGNLKSHADRLAEIVRSFEVGAVPGE